MLPRIAVSLLMLLFIGSLSFAQGTILELYGDEIPCANDLEEEVVMDDRIGRRVSKVHKPTVEVYLPGENANGSAVVICPGGGYTILAYDWEGTRMAEWFNSFGVAAFVLKYRLPHWETEDCRDKVALADAQEAMKMVRDRAYEFNVDPTRVGVMGFSAGGHLASTLSTHYDSESRPDFSILMYPVVTFDPEVAHPGSAKNLLGENASQAELDHFSNEKQVDENTPPAILIHAQDDKAVPAENSIRYYQALLKAGVPAAMHIYASGGHGFSFAEGLGAVEQWPMEVKQWMDDSGFLEDRPDPTDVAEEMVAAATKLMAQLSLDQNKALFDFDDPSRTIWTFLPVSSAGRPGVPLSALSSEQVEAVHGLVSSGLSKEGYEKVKEIMSLEKILQVLEPNNPGRDPDQYHIAMYGTPSLEGTWGWKFEGHHVVLNFTMADGQVVGVPTFLGSNPAEVKSGDRKGFRALAIEEDLGFELLSALSYRNQTKAIFQQKAPWEIVSFTSTQTGPLAEEGIIASQMNDKARKKLDELIESYLSVMPVLLQQQRRDKLDKAGRDNISFAWAGAKNRNAGHYYRVQGPTFLIEFANTQNDANHAHAVWRDFSGDFGRDILKDHMMGGH